MAQRVLESSFENSVCNISMDSSRGSELDSSSDYTETSSDTVPYLLDHLKLPQPSDLARKRKIDVNHPPIGKKTGRGCTTNDPKSVLPAERVKAIKVSL